MLKLSEDKQQLLVLVGPGNLGKAVLELADAEYANQYQFWSGILGKKQRTISAGKRYLVGTFEEGMKTLPALINEQDELQAKPPIIIDCSKGAIADHARLFCDVGIDFVMLSTGEGVNEVKDIVDGAGDMICVQDVNMSSALMTLYGSIFTEARKNVNGLKGYTFHIVESHQASKSDISGTAKRLSRALQNMGAIPNPQFAHDIESIRDPEVQEKVFDVPKGFLDAHAYHTVTLVDQDNNVLYFGSKVHGRSVYARGTLGLAIPFLQKKIAAGDTGHFTMADVLAETF